MGWFEKLDDLGWSAVGIAWLLVAGAMVATFLFSIVYVLFMGT